MCGDVITKESIKDLVDYCYQKVRGDGELGPIFDADIGEDAQD